MPPDLPARLDGQPEDSIRPAGAVWRPPRRLLIVAALVALAGIGVRLGLTPENLDDAYITYRYARNLARGDGFVYNPGERVLGTTTPGWTLALAAGERLGWPADRLGPTLAGIAGGCLAGVVVLLAGSAGAGPVAAGLAGALWATDPLAVRVDLGGMEASAFSLLAYLALLGSRLARRTATRVGVGLAAAGAALLRPEGLLVLMLVPAAAWWVRRRWRLEAVSALIPVAAWLTWSWWYFGSPLPQSMLAKAAVHQGWGGVATALAFGRDAHMFLVHLDATRIGAVVAGLVACAALLGSVRRPAGIAPAAFALLYVAAYVVASPELFVWYHVPPGPAVVAAVAAAASWLVAQLGTVRRVIAAVVVLAVLGVMVAGSRWLAPMPAGGRVIALEPSDREPRYLAAGAVLIRAGAGAGTRVASPEIGALGWSLDRVPILDAVGLVSPEALPVARRATRETLMSGVISRFQPEFVVLPASFAPPPAALTALLGSYREVARLGGGTRLGPWILILERRPAPVP